jgi:peptidoglycan/LPS O-acetylase OafA/YrhL
LFFLGSVSTMTDGALRGHRETGRSFGHLLLVWLLVGYSFMALGWDLTEALPVAIPLAPIDAGLVFGTLVVCALWVAGVRPSLRVSLAYFGVHAVVRVAATLLYLAIPGTTPGPWPEIGVDLVAILVAAACCLSGLGRQFLGGLVRRTQAQFEQPATEENHSPRR